MKKDLFDILRVFLIIGIVLLSAFKISGNPSIYSPNVEDTIHENKGDYGWFLFLFADTNTKLEVKNESESYFSIGRLQGTPFNSVLKSGFQVYQNPFLKRGTMFLHLFLLYCNLKVDCF